MADQQTIRDIIARGVAADMDDDDIALAVEEYKRTQPPSGGGNKAAAPETGVMSDDAWAKLSGGEKMRNMLQWGGKAIGGAFFGPAGVEAAENPKMTMATAAIPLAGRKLINMVPRAGRAGAKLQDVMSAAKDAPVDVEDAGQVALRIQQLSERGGAMPKAARDMLRRVTDPERPPMDYGEIRDFASNIGRVSANESGRLTPVIRREMKTLHAAANKAAHDAATSVGKGAEHAAGMREYAQAMRLRGLGNAVKDGAKQAIPYAGATGGTYWLMNKLMGGGW